VVAGWRLEEVELEEMATEMRGEEAMAGEAVEASLVAVLAAVRGRLGKGKTAMAAAVAVMGALTEAVDS